MHVVRHETPRLKGESESPPLFMQQAKVLSPIRVVPKDCHGSHPALGDMMRQSGNHYAADPWHAAILLPPNAPVKDN
jgi:hypothetical protein